jgi:hypothetical protein
LKTFGCESFVHIDKKNKTKLEEKSKKCTFIGYNVNDFGYRLWDYENKKIIRSRYVIYSMRRSYKKINCRERNMKKKNQNTQCLMRSLKKKFQRYYKIKIYNMINIYLKLLQVLLEDLSG